MQKERFVTVLAFSVIKIVIPEPHQLIRWSSFLYPSATTYIMKPWTVDYQHLLYMYTAYLMTSTQHLLVLIALTDGCPLPRWVDLDGWLNNKTVWTWMEPVKTSKMPVLTRPNWNKYVDRDQWLLFGLSHTTALKVIIGLRQFY